MELMNALERIALSNVPPEESFAAQTMAIALNWMKEMAIIEEDVFIVSMDKILSHFKA